MRINARIVNHNNIEEPISKFELNEIPSRGSYIIDGKGIQYSVFQSLFTKKDGDFYYFEQVICKYPRGESEPFIPYVLLGTIYLQKNYDINNEQDDALYAFRDVHLKTDDDVYIKIDEMAKLPYGYLRIYDMYKIDEFNALKILAIRIDNKEVLIELHHIPILIESFRHDEHKVPKGYY